MSDIQKYQPTVLQPLSSSVKSFWRKPEGKTGMAIMAALGIAGLTGGLILWAKVLPFLIMVVQNTLYLTLSGVALAAVWFLLTNKQVRAVSSALFKSLCWHLTNWVITIDPEGIAQATLKQLQEAIERMTEKIGAMAGKIKSAKEEARKIHAEAEECRTTIQGAGKAAARLKQEAAARGETADLTKYTSTMSKNESFLSGRERYLRELEPEIERMEIVLDRLQKIETAAQDRQQMLADSLRLVIRKRRIFKDVRDAISSAASVLQGSDALDLHNRSVEQMVDEYSLDSGRLDVFLRDIGPVIDQIEVGDSIRTQKALDLIESFERKAPVLLGEGEKPVVLEMGGTIEREKVPVEGRGGFAQTVKKKMGTLQ